MICDKLFEDGHKKAGVEKQKPLEIQIENCFDSGVKPKAVYTQKKLESAIFDVKKKKSEELEVPKRQKNCYQIFMKENKPKIQKAEKLTNRDAYVKCRSQWHAMKDKSEYVEKADKDKERY